MTPGSFVKEKAEGILKNLMPDDQEIMQAWIQSQLDSQSNRELTNQKLLDNVYAFVVCVIAPVAAILALCYGLQGFAQYIQERNVQSLTEVTNALNVCTLQRDTISDKYIELVTDSPVGSMSPSLD